MRALRAATRTLGQRPRPAVSRDGRPDGWVVYRQPHRKVYEENVKVIKKAWTEEAWDYDGEYYKCHIHIKRNPSLAGRRLDPQLRRSR